MQWRRMACCSNGWHMFIRHHKLLFSQLFSINSNLQVPTTAVIVFGALTAVIALLFNIETLVEFLSIGTLMAYTIVSASVVILRYRPDRVKAIEDTLGLTSSKPSTPVKGKQCDTTLL